MNCKQIQELLPLYVSRDVEEKRARLIATHLQSCTVCAGSAAEYEETSRLLQGFAPPTFSEAAYAGIRRRVWREIERKEATAPSLPQTVAGLFRPRLSWAVATAALVAVSLFAFYFIANPSNKRREIAEVLPAGLPKGPEAIPSPASQPNSAPPFNGPERNKDSDHVLSASGDHTQATQQRKRLRTVVDRLTVAVHTPAPPSIGTQIPPENTSPAEPNIPGEPAAGGKILRVELQTRDPNIRIIWFSPQRTKQDSPGKFSKGV
jgi:putative zinc finger protein